MTSHKPFTAEQLDGLERGYRNTYWACLDPETRGRLIAQAREEIRLRGENRTLREACADLAGTIGANADYVPDVVLDAWGPVDHLLARLGGSEDPVARAKREPSREELIQLRVGEVVMRLEDSGVLNEDQAEEFRAALDCNPSRLTEAERAKRELGEWLAEAPERSFLPMRYYAATKTYGITLLTHVVRGDDGARCHYGSGPTEHEAITAALRAAKEKP